MQAFQIAPRADVEAPEKKSHLPLPKLMKHTKEKIPKPPKVDVKKAGPAPKTKPTYGYTKVLMTPKHKSDVSIYYA